MRLQSPVLAMTRSRRARRAVAQSVGISVVILATFGLVLIGAVLAVRR